MPGGSVALGGCHAVGRRRGSAWLPRPGAATPVQGATGAVGTGAQVSVWGWWPEGDDHAEVPGSRGRKRGASAVTARCCPEGTGGRGKPAPGAAGGQQAAAVRVTA